MNMLSVTVLSALTLFYPMEMSAVPRRFPEGFIFGASTSAYQIEGAWNSDDKTENIWDYLTHTKPHMIRDSTNADIACDSYHNYKRDVQMMRELGLHAYRFSLSWSRILPSGLPYKISKAGVTYYNNYINEILKYNITPIVTLYHWDLPQSFQNYGGFINPMISDWFENYARVAFSLFGDRVKKWITFNEPSEVCQEGYAMDRKAPAVNSSGIGGYICAKHILVAHAKAYHAYNNFFKSRQGGEIGITLHIDSFVPMTDSREDKSAAEMKNQAEWGMYTDPIFSREGGYPKELVERVANKSTEQGFPETRMPDLSDEEKILIQGSADFLGVNHYSGQQVSATRYLQTWPVPSIMDDIDVGLHMPEEWPRSASDWLARAPNSHFKVLMQLHKKYGNIPILITETGWSTKPQDSLNDEGRIEYYRRALEDVLDAIDAGVNIGGFMAWSLMDNFEWMCGYTERYGLYHVDFQDPDRTRTPRKSAFVYKEIIKKREVDWDYNPNTMAMTIDEANEL